MVLTQEKKGMRLGKYELGRTLGEGNFGKVKYAKNLDSGQSFAIKILEKNRILDLNITDQVVLFTRLLLQTFIFLYFSYLHWRLQIKREIGTLKLLKHPNVVRLYEVYNLPCQVLLLLDIYEIQIHIWLGISICRCHLSMSSCLSKWKGCLVNVKNRVCVFRLKTSPWLVVM